MEEVSSLSLPWTSELSDPGVWESLEKQTPNHHIMYSSLEINTDYEDSHSMLQFYPRMLNY